MIAIEREWCWCPTTRPGWPWWWWLVMRPAVLMKKMRGWWWWWKIWWWWWRWWWWWCLAMSMMDPLWTAARPIEARDPVMLFVRDRDPPWIFIWIGLNWPTIETRRCCSSEIDPELVGWVGSSGYSKRMASTLNWSEMVDYRDRVLFSFSWNRPDDDDDDYHHAKDLEMHISATSTLDWSELTRIELVYHLSGSPTDLNLTGLPLMLMMLVMRASAN